MGKTKMPTSITAQGESRNSRDHRKWLEDEEYPTAYEHGIQVGTRAIGR
jgi:hypothetical protein